MEVSTLSCNIRKTRHTLIGWHPSPINGSREKWAIEFDADGGLRGGERK